MKNNIIKTATILLILLFCSTASAHDIKKMAALGDSCYRASEYTSAITYYETVLDSGFSSADIYYNLGNAYYRTSDYTHAILNYERALRLKPTMHDANHNLALAKDKTTDRIETLPRLFFLQWIDTLTTAVTPAVWRIVFLFLLAVVVAAVVLVIVGRGLQLRKCSLACAIVAGLFMLVSATLLVSSTKRYNDRADAIIMQPSVAVKSSPEMQSVDIMVLHEGTKVHIDESLEGWNKITIADGTTGWCQTEAIERI